MSRHSPHPDQTSLTFSQRADLEDLIATRASVQAEAQAWHWRLRLIVMESGMMAAFLFGGSLALHQTWPVALRNAVLVGGSCLLAGVLTLALAGLAGRLASRVSARFRACLAKRSATR
jgi:hypothetical protein